MDSVLASLKPFVDVAQAASALIAAFTFLVGAGTLWKSISEYRRGNSLKRFEKFQEMRRRFEGDGSIKVVSILLAENSDDLYKLDYRIKEDFLGFYEEIALMNQSNLLNDDIMYYMFGYYALRAYENDNFRRGIDLSSPYWTLFCSLYERLKVREQDIAGGRIEASTISKRLRF